MSKFKFVVNATGVTLFDWSAGIYQSDECFIIRFEHNGVTKLDKEFQSLTDAYDWINRIVGDASLDSHKALRRMLTAVDLIDW